MKIQIKFLLSQGSLQLFIFGVDFLCCFFAIGLVLFIESLIGNRTDFHSQESSILCAVNGYRGHRNSGRHLHDRKQGIHAIQFSTGKRHPNHRFQSQTGHHAGQCRCHAGTGVRTGRAGASGLAVTLVTGADARHVSDIEKLTKKKIDVEPFALEERSRGGGDRDRYNDGHRERRDTRSRDRSREEEPQDRRECVVKAQWERGWRYYGGRPARLRRPELPAFYTNRLRPDDSCPLVPVPAADKGAES